MYLILTSPLPFRFCVGWNATEISWWDTDILSEFDETCTRSVAAWFQQMPQLTLTPNLTAWTKLIFVKTNYLCLQVFAYKKNLEMFCISAGWVLVYTSLRYSWAMALDDYNDSCSFSSYWEHSEGTYLLKVGLLYIITRQLWKLRQASSSYVSITSQYFDWQEGKWYK
jgi:hypothetical protein